MPEFGEVPGKAPRRVKVYLLQGEDWIDNGTGYCVGEVEEESRKPYFLVRNELNTDEIILKSFLEGSIQYQRQQETLIVWTDLSGKDLALSFQETEACADLCEFIIKIQQEKYAPEISLYYVIPNNNIIDEEYSNANGNANNGTGTIPTEITELVTGPINFPDVPPTLDNLEHVLELINQGSNSQYTRSSISKFIKEEEYLLALISVFNKAEKLQKLDSLHITCECVKTLILYNEASIIEDFVSTEEKIYGLVGILEYDQEYPNFKASYRDYLNDKSKFKHVIDLPDKEILKIFKNDFHLNFLKDVVLARFLDDQTFNLISSLIYFNQVEIINFLKDTKKENKFLDELFKLYERDESEEADEKKETDIDCQRRRDGVKLLHQYVLIAKSLQSFQKSEFFAVLVKKGLFKMVGFALRDSEATVRTLGTELIVVIIEQDASLVNSIDNDIEIDNSDPPTEQRIPPKLEEEAGDESLAASDETGNGRDFDVTVESKLHLKLSDDMTLMQILTKLLIEDKNPGLKMQAFEALRILLDSNIATNSLTPNGSSGSGNNEFEIDHLRNEFNNEKRGSTGNGAGDDFKDINTSNYFQAFYAQVAPELFANLIKFGERQNGAEIDTLLLQHLCDLISFCTKEHESYISKPFFLKNNILLGIGKVIGGGIATKTTLKLTAIRCLKNIILLNDDDYVKYIIDHNIFGFIFKFFKTISNENNLANSSCLDLLEIIIRNEINPNSRTLAKFIYCEEREFLEHELNYVSTGKDFIHIVEKCDNNELDLNSHNASTPINNDEIDDEIELEDNKNPVKIFNGIETEIKRNGEKRHLEEDEVEIKKKFASSDHGINEKHTNGADADDVDVDQSENGTAEEEETTYDDSSKTTNGNHDSNNFSPKKLSKSIKGKLSSASKKIAHSLKQNAK
ncbi:serine/threonine-protein phosphatase 4 regulatory subunit 3 [[Candida] railenensis]|uniref:Serine/threonine-protein phosphatase 4 regulatory subunit 3 n=1 Tax=[Candida] railenensis TaxID=45579 RepID=A0A9P0VWM5_9ASCO|nr:serine/threonine-protein phosphatase 4 regulatory subunit 3 [[Candida] railenensis]